MKKNILSCLLIALFFVGCNNKEHDTAELATVVADMNKKCPQVIDSETRLDGLELKEPNTLIYKYTLINLNVAVVDTHQFYLAMWPGLLSTIKVSTEMKQLRENEVTIEYDYKDKFNKPVYLFKITPKDYK